MIPKEDLESVSKFYLVGDEYRDFSHFQDFLNYFLPEVYLEGTINNDDICSANNMSEGIYIIRKWDSCNDNFMSAYTRSPKVKLHGHINSINDGILSVYTIGS